MKIVYRAEQVLLESINSDKEIKNTFVNPKRFSI